MHVLGLKQVDPEARGGALAAAPVRDDGVGDRLWPVRPRRAPPPAARAPFGGRRAGLARVEFERTRSRGQTPRPQMKLVIQIPCYNEADTLPGVLADLPRAIPGVDSDRDPGHRRRFERRHRRASRARTASRASYATAATAGSRSTFLTGLEAALEMGADIIVNTDGDHQYPGASIPELVAPIVRARGRPRDRRPADASTTRKVSPQKRLFYNLGNFVVRSATGVSVHDAPSGFRAMSREFAMSVYLTNPFSYTLETIFAAAEHRHPIREVAIRSNPVDAPESLVHAAWSSTCGARPASSCRATPCTIRCARSAGCRLPFLVLGVGARLALRLLLPARTRLQRPHPVADPGLDLDRRRRADPDLRHARLAGARQPLVAARHAHARAPPRAAGRRAQAYAGRRPTASATSSGTRGRER